MKPWLRLLGFAVGISSVLGQDQPERGERVSLPFANAQLTLPPDMLLLSRDSSVIFLRDRFHPNYDVDAVLTPSAGDNHWNIRLKYYRAGFLAMEELQDEIRSIDVPTLMKLRVSNENKLRELEGYQTVIVTRLIEQPLLDHDRQLLEFAIETLQDTLFSVERHLLFFGRHGFLHAAVTVAQGYYPPVKAASTDLLSTLSFNPGERYTDSDPDSDTTAFGGLELVFFGKVPERTNWIFPVIVGLIILVSVGLFFYDKLVPEKKPVLPGRRRRSTARGQVRRR